MAALPPGRRIGSPDSLRTGQRIAPECKSPAEWNPKRLSICAAVTHQDGVRPENW
jgi:hypothetical protein